jgi:hypothetical protein
LGNPQPSPKALRKNAVFFERAMDAVHRLNGGGRYGKNVEFKIDGIFKALKI